MRLEVLLSTMHQTDDSIMNEMGIKTDAIIVNQTDHYNYQEIRKDGRLIRIFDCAERGVGLSRNTALMRARGDICLFADDDVRYAEDYERVILDEFSTHPEADLVAFNVPSTSKDQRMKDYIAGKWRRLSYMNCFRHGTFRIACRREVILKNSITFSILFGGGAQYSAGEDSLFLADCLRRKLKLYESEKVIGTVSHAESTWFNGYTDKYFFDKGAFFACLSPAFPFMGALYFAIRKYHLYQDSQSFCQALRLMHRGIREYRNRNKE